MDSKSAHPDFLDVFFLEALFSGGLRFVPLEDLLQAKECPVLSNEGAFFS
jgi:hypothetical protein